MREIPAATVTETVARLCQEANYFLPDEVLAALREAATKEESTLARQALEQLVENAAITVREQVPLCQDCGQATVFLDVGQDVHVSAGYLYDAVQEGVRRGYEEGYLRKSIVSQPFSARVNTGDNTPAVIHTEIVPGDRLRVAVLPKGAGSENMSRLFMLTPAQAREGVIESVVRAVDEAGSSPCPPVIVGVGVGGSADMAMVMAKRALLRPLGAAAPDAEVNDLEKELLRRINALGIGAEGLGGRTTALAVHVETYPAHIASLPVGVSILCHAARHREETL